MTFKEIIFFSCLVLPMAICLDYDEIDYDYDPVKLSLRDMLNKGYEMISNTQGLNDSYEAYMNGEISIIDFLQAKNAYEKGFSKMMQSIMQYTQNAHQWMNSMSQPSFFNRLYGNQPITMNNPSYLDNRLTSQDIMDALN